MICIVMKPALNFTRTPKVIPPAAQTTSKLIAGSQANPSPQYFLDPFNKCGLWSSREA